MKNKICSVLFSVAVFLFIATFSIGLPIYSRPFYYVHIDAMELDVKSGFSKSEIKEAYNEVLDYLTIPGKDFSTGVMRHSESGAAHFADCKVLFDLNASVFVISVITIITLIVLHKRGKIKRPLIRTCSSEFWAAMTAIILLLVLGSIALIDFDKTFVVFHKVFFPGKTNWIFDIHCDQIISVLPQKFFMNCSILIACGILVISLALVVKEIGRAHV